MHGHFTPAETLEHLRKHAKRRLKAFHMGDQRTVRWYKGLLPGASPTPTLRDMQLAVARSLDFPGWTALTRALETHSKAIDRSRALARGKWRYVLGTVLLSWALAFLLLIGAGAVAGALGGNDRVIGFLSDLLFGAVFPVPAIAMTLLYYDLRVQNEGADLDAMLSELPASTPT